MYEIAFDSNLGYIVCDSGLSYLIFSSNISVASDCNLGPLNCDSGCIDYNLVAFGDFGNLGGEASLFLDRFGKVSGS